MLLVAAGLDPVQVEAIAQLALEEDLDQGVDVTTVATISEDAVATGDFTAREAGTVAGLRIAEAVLSSSAPTSSRSSGTSRTATGSRPAPRC